MKNYCLLCLFSLLSLFSQAQQKPNIIVFLVDDMGWMDTSVPFGDSMMPLNKKYHTPNMERLARAGMKFTNAYATPVCTPSRTSMLTGMNAAHHGITNWTSPVKNNPTDDADTLMSPAAWMINGLSPSPGIPLTAYATVFPQILKDAGYFTIHAGKAHWASAGTPGANPYNMGFMVNISGHAAGHPQSYLGKENYGNKPGKASVQAVPDLEEYYGTDTFLTEALTLEAIKSMEAPINNKQPFYLNMAHYAVHAPIQSDKRFRQKYLAAGLDTIEASYASMVEGMDKSLGDIMDYLASKKVDGNTVIIFMSDNGGLSLTPPRGGVTHSQNLPLRAGKGSVYEGGIREPMIVKWPGITKAGAVCSVPVIIEDFFPTVMEIAGVKAYKTVQKIDGISFVPQLKGLETKTPDRMLIWHFPNKWIAKNGPGINYHSAIRYGNWKLVYNMYTKTRELYNLKTDMGETRDLSAENETMVRSLSVMLTKQLKTYNAPMPKYKATGKPVPWPAE